MIHLITRALFLLLFLVTAVPALAQPRTLTIKEELPEALRDDWEAAGDMFDDGNYRGALVQYQRIYDETKNPRILYNIGISHKELRRYAKALGAWEKQLIHRDKLPKKEVERAEKAIEVVRPFVSTLTITSNQAGATLIVNGDEVGQTPFLASIPVDVGENVLVLKKEGYVTLERTIEVARGAPAAVTLDLLRIDKTAVVTIAIAGAESAIIFMDGTELGPAPFKGEVPVGRHTFEARAPGFVTARQTSEVVEGEPVRITLSLVKALAEGKVKIVTDHPDAVIRIDDEVVGYGAWEGVLTAGGHKLTIAKDGYQTHEAELALVADQERELRITLEKQETAAWIYWGVTSVLVVAGTGVASYFVLRPSEGAPVTGTFNPGIVPTLFSF
jgi:hypothetical protein